MHKNTKIAVAIIIIVFVVIVAVLLAYLKMELSQLSVSPPPPLRLGPESFVSYVSGQDLLFYNYGGSIVPTLILNYTSRNISNFYVYDVLYKTPIPSTIYFLNATNECIGCGNINQFIVNLEDSLINYGVITNQAGLIPVSLQNVTGIANDSILIIPNGLMPSTFFQSYSNTTVLQYLISKGTSIIYIGRNFSNMLLPGSVITPSNNVPSFLSTTAYSRLKTASGVIPNSSFYFSSPTFSLINGTSYYNITYANIRGAGSIIAFSNYLNSWKSTSAAASDISESIAMLFWVPYYAYGYESVPTKSLALSGGNIVLMMNEPQTNYSYPLINVLDSGHGRVDIYTNSTFSAPANSLFYYTYFNPKFSVNGTLSVSGTISPSSATNVQMQVFTNTSVPVLLEPHITLYRLNGSAIYSIPLPPVSASGNFTFIKSISFLLGPGSYIASLQSLSNQRYADALIYVPPLAIKPLKVNFSSGSFVFFISDAGIPLSGVNYSISASGLYPEEGVAANGTISYAFPHGAPQLFGNVSFTLNMFSENFTYIAYNPPQVIKINSQYVELAVVVIIVFLMIVLVRSPNRDDFYIDVPILPPQSKTQIKIQAKELLGSFDKLNMYYHWKFMPLSKKEIRNAISSYIRYGNVPVNLTYNNIDLLLAKMQGAGMVIERDGLFIPSYWVLQSGHDADYLATFKKLRTFFVSNTFIFSDLDSSNLADMVATIHGDRVYINIYSESSKFKSLTLYPDIKTYIAFLNADKLEEFRSKLYSSTTKDSEELKMYISSGFVKLIDADDPGEQIT